MGLITNKAAGSNQRGGQATHSVSASMIGLPWSDAKMPGLPSRTSDAAGSRARLVPLRHLRDFPSSPVSSG